MRWIDSHCHLDAPEFDADREQVVANARTAGVVQMVIPAVHPAHFEKLVALAHEFGFYYAAGIHPMWMDYAPEASAHAKSAHTSDAQLLAQLKAALEQYRDDPLLVAIGEIGLDYFLENLDKKRQWFFYTEQLKLAKQWNLPVILHVRKSADMLLKGLRQVGINQGIAHAFNGSLKQAKSFISLGFKLGFGGACTFERARQIRQLAQSIPLASIVLETDAPDMPPQWLYKTMQQRLDGQTQARNEPKELARIAQVVAELREISVQALFEQVLQNTLAVFPKIELV